MQRNWRNKEPGNDASKATVSNYQGRNESIDNTGLANAANVRTLTKSNNSEFAEELCWDVETTESKANEELEIRVVSPRIAVLIFDSGSEVTCVSEALVNELEKRYKLIKLPVSNLSVCVAVRNKATVVKQQIQISCKINQKALEFPCLVVPGLSADVFFGMDWLGAFSCVIDMETKQIILNGEYLPKCIV